MKCTQTWPLCFYVQVFRPRRVHQNVRQVHLCLEQGLELILVLHLGKEKGSNLAVWGGLPLSFSMHASPLEALTILYSTTFISLFTSGSSLVHLMYLLVAVKVLWELVTTRHLAWKYPQAYQSLSNPTTGGWPLLLCIDDSKFLMVHL